MNRFDDWKKLSNPLGYRESLIGRSNEAYVPENSLWKKVDVKRGIASPGI